MDWQHSMGDDVSTSVVDNLHECSTSYGGGFAAGFTGFLASGEFSDICVVFHGQEHHLHSLILGYHSEFFRRAFSSGMRESTQQRLELSIEDPLQLLPLVMAYFYEGQIILTDKTCFGMLAIARQLMVAKLETYCRDFIDRRLNLKCCMRFLLAGVQYNDEQLQENCVALFARNIHTSYTQTAEGLPPETIEAILTHKDLQVQCEAQVLLFVLDYIDGTQVEPAVAAQLFQHVRMAYLSNERLVWLQEQSQSSLPADLLLQGALLRLKMQDQPSEMASAVMQPRSSYCSNLQYGLPGGQEHIDLPVHHVWDLLAPGISVKVSGVSEGRPRNVVLGSRQEGPDRWFSTSESAHPAPWVELHLPQNVRLLSLQHYTFTHGHHRSSYFRMQKWESQAGSTSCMRPGARFYSLQHKLEGAQQQGNDYLVSLAEYRPPVKHDWRVLRLVGAGPQQDGVHRLSLKDLKLYGTVRVNLLEQAEGMCITKAEIQAALSQSPSGVHPSTNRPRALQLSPTRIVPPVTHSLYQNQY
ncbi:hypothetical protein WJX77_004596 [Trebouxia sp. C0004]